MNRVRASFHRVAARLGSASPLRTLRAWPSRCRQSVVHSLDRLTHLAELRLRQRTRPLCRQLAAVDPALAQLADDLEQRFLACGASLQEQVRLTARLGTQGRALNRVASADSAQAGALPRVRALLDTHLQLSSTLTREVETLADTLDRYAAHLHELLSDQQQLERSFAPMRVLHSFFRIESAALPPEQQALFHAVTAEMQRLHADVAESFATHTAALAATRERVLAATDELHARARQLRELAARKRDDVQSALARLESGLSTNRERHHRLEAAIAGLERETDTLTVSLQYQDITRQKLEHVRAAARHVLEHTSQSDSTPFAQRARTQQVLCEVQAAQLQSVHEELAHAARTVTSGLEALRTQLQRIEDDCLPLAGLQELTAGLDAAADELQAVHRVTAELMHDALGSLGHAIRIAHSFADATTGATGTMRRIAWDLLLMGLNAQVQAYQANHGSLEVLSGAVSQLSNEAGALTARFEGKLAATTENLTRLVQQSEALHQRTLAEHEALAASHTSVLRDFAAEQESAKGLLLEVGSLLRELTTQADGLLASLDLAQFSQQPIHQAREVFTALAGVFGQAAPAGAADDAAALQELHERYTMQSERTAHAAVIRAAGLAGAATAVAAGVAGEPVAASRAADTTDAALGDNVELF